MRHINGIDRLEQQVVEVPVGYRLTSISLLCLMERFLAKLDRVSSPYGCWLNGKTSYGSMRGVGGVPIKLHRLAWVLFRGPIPAHLSVLHNCPGGSNASCSNPDHLYLGTQQQNVADCVREGRIATGSRNGSRTHPECVTRGSAVHTAKLTEEQVREIRRLYATGNYSSRKLAKMFNVSKGIWRIVNCSSWKQVH